jgi:effector-binding domain-containing protein
MTDIGIVELEPQPTAVVGELVPLDKLTDFFGRAFSEVMAATGRQGVAVTGPPFALYHGVPTDTVHVEAGFPTSSEVEADGDVRPGVLPGGRVVEALHVGSYDTLSQTYDAVVRWAVERGLKPGSDMWEQYLTDPSDDSDPSSWRTRVLCPVT